LTIVQTNTELLQDQLATLGAGEVVAEHLSDIGEAVARGSELVRRLMAFGRSEPERVRTLDLGELISGYATTLRRVLPDDVKVEVAVGPDVPPVRVDPGAVQQVLLNLVTNARDAMTGGGSLRLTVTSAPAEHKRPGVLLSVADTGTGIEADHLEHVFEPFFTTKDADRGTGLGLSMVQELVRQMDGSVEVSSELGRGTEFVLRFPPAQDLGDGASGLEARPTRSQGGHAAGTVLIVEDDASVRKVIRRALASAGYEVIVTADGEQALEAFNRHPEAVDLVVSDLIMPNMDGASLHRALQSREGPDVPFLFISGYGDRDPRVEELLERGVPILHKPWSMAALCEAVQDALLVSSVSKEVDSSAFPGP
ncbi:MAG: response regulator, partial [Gemmatimonadetes bacterium]|nr:response regulator [Gemmatimonadota bacterium]